MASNNTDFLERCKIVFIFSNPPRHLVSYYRHQWNLHKDSHIYNTGKNGSSISLEEFIFSEGGIGSFVKQFLTYHHVRAKYPDMILMVPYE